MKNCKRFLAAFLALVAVLALAACTPNEPSSPSTNPQPSKSEPAPSQSESTTPEKKVTFRVKVVDEDGKIMAGVGVQLCKESCVIVETNEEGWAEFTNTVEDGYHANVAYEPDGFEIPEGKKVDDTAFDFKSGETEMTLTLKLVDEAEKE